MEVGSRYDLRAGRSPDAPETEGFEGAGRSCGWVHSYETGSTVDGPGMRVDAVPVGLPAALPILPQSRHLAYQGRHEDRAAACDPAARRLRARRCATMGGGLTISGGEPLVQVGFTHGLFAAAKRMGLHTALDTSGFLGTRADDDYLKAVDLVLLDIKSAIRRPTAR